MQVAVHLLALPIMWMPSSIRKLFKYADCAENNCSVAACF